MDVERGERMVNEEHEEMGREDVGGKEVRLGRRAGKTNCDVNRRNHKKRLTLNT